MTTYKDHEGYLKAAIKETTKDLKFLKKKKPEIEKIDDLMDHNKEGKGGIIYSVNLRADGMMQGIYFDIHISEKMEEQVMEIISQFSDLLLSEGYSIGEVHRRTYFDGRSLVYSKTGRLKTEDRGEDLIRLEVVSHSPLDCLLVSYEETVTKYKLDCGKGE